MTTETIAARISLAALSFAGSDLQRPECVLTTASGALYTSDWRGGVARTLPDGSQKLFAARLPDGRPLKPNGIALRADGSFLLADLGDHQGGIFHLQRDGTVTPFLEAVDGVPLPPSNYVVEDGQRTWLTVSTRQQPRALAYRSDIADGFVAVIDQRGARIVAGRRPRLHQRSGAESRRSVAVRQ